MRQKISETRSGSYVFSADSVDVGTRIADRYEVLRHLGRGAFCDVFEARDDGNEGVSCAIKIPRAGARKSECVDTRFRLEAHATSLLKSPHTASAFDFGVLPDGRPFFAMEFLKGLSLAGLLARDGAVNEAHVAMIGIDVLHALHEAHERGIVHRDLKPSNVLVVQNPRAARLYARLIDFGIAKVLDAESLGRAPMNVTGRGRSPCTPMYAAPEQFGGLPSARSDLYALGMLLATLLEGEAPYAKLNPNTIASQQVSVDPVPFGKRTRASALFPVLEIACNKRPDQRFGSALAMRRALRTTHNEILQHSPPPVLQLTDVDMDFEGVGTTDAGGIEPL